VRSHDSIDRDSRTNHGLIGQDLQAGHRARERQANREVLAEGRDKDPADSGHSAGVDRFRLQSRALSGRDLQASRNLIGLEVQVGHHASGQSQDPERDHGGNLARRGEGRPSKSSENRRGDSKGRQAAALVGESRGREGREQDRLEKAARVDPLRERGLSNVVSRAAASGSRVDFRSPVAKERLIGASRAVQNTGARIGLAVDRAVESADECSVCSVNWRGPQLILHWHNEQA
jgi:hypothetical protein